MKKTIALLFSMILVVTLSVNANAAYYGYGTTSGGTAGKLNCNASLNVTQYAAAATTGINSPTSVSSSSYILATSVNLRYRNEYGHQLNVTGTGTASASAANPTPFYGGISAVSYHTVDGSKGGWGSWSYSLSGSY